MVDEASAACAGAWRAFTGSSESHTLRRLLRGHIHESYVVESEGAPIANAEVIEPFVRGRVAARMLTKSNEPCVIDAAGEFWRAYAHLGASRNMDLPESSTQCFAAGAAFGGFQAALEDLPPDQLRISIKGFQDFKAVLGQFDLAIKSDSYGRLSSSSHVANELLARKGQVPALSGPFGIVHGDCKFNNIQFDASGERVIAVLDLDTVMWHRRALDFGDLVRAGAVHGGEDDVDAEIDLERVSAFAAGFRDGIGALAPKSQALFDALLHVTFMLALRFYSDHLHGDVYFHIEAPEDNLRRAQGQLALFKQLVRRRVELLEACK